MNEARRFLRYLLPGLVALVEGLLLAVILNSQCVWEAVQALGETGGGAGLSVVGVGLVTGLGYLSSMLHHACLRMYGAADHRRFLQQAQDAGLIALERRDRPDANGHPQAQAVNWMGVKRREAWRVLCALWYENLRKGTRISGSHARQDSFGDLAHGSGTIFMGSWLVCLLIVWACLEGAFMPFDWRRVLIAFLAWAFFTGFVYVNTHRLMSVFFRFPEIVLWDHLRHPKQEEERPHVIGISEDDIGGLPGAPTQ